MRMLFRPAADVVIAGQHFRARVRPVKEENQLHQTPFGVQGQERVRLLLPRNAQVFVRDGMTWQGRQYACCAVCRYDGHVQADFQRCAL